MGKIILPKQFHPDFMTPGVKPLGPYEIDDSSDLGQGLACVWMFDDSSGTIRDLTGNFKNGSITNGSFGINSLGNSVLVCPDSVAHAALVPDFKPLTEGTLIVKLSRTASDGGNMRVLGTIDQYEFTLGITGLFRSNLCMAAGGTEDAITSATTGNWYTVSMRFHLGSNRSSIIVDGVQERVSNVADDDPGAIRDMYIGNANHTTPRSVSDAFIGEIEYIVWKSYEVDEGESREWAWNPYQFLKPIQPVMYFIPSGLVQTQTAFKWFADGTEAGAAQLANQNVDISQAGSTIGVYRAQVNNTGDPPSQQMKLQVKLDTNDDTTYRDVPIAP